MNDFSPYLQDLQPTVAQLNQRPNSTLLNSVDLGLASLVITFPILLTLTIAGYRNYRNRRLRSQILMLERIWNLKSQKYR